jgi:hypothetical protein
MDKCQSMCARLTQLSLFAEFEANDVMVPFPGMELVHIGKERECAGNSGEPRHRGTLEVDNGREKPIATGRL